MKLPMIIAVAFTLLVVVLFFKGAFSKPTPENPFTDKSNKPN